MGKKEKKATVLIVDDELNFAESLQMAIEDLFDVSVCQTLRSAREILLKDIPDAVLLDIRLPDGEGIELIKDLKDSDRFPVVIVMTAHATVETAIRSLKEGAVDYFTKPFDVGKLKRDLEIYLENKSLKRKISNLDREISRIVPPFITSGKGAMKTIVEQVPTVAPLSIPILIQGETGTGKEKLAQWIHELSGLPGELVTLSCATLPKDLFESELFGYVKGAFSGAAGAKEGLIECADRGTLFLDEIGELADETQAKLLRVLESGHYFKLGDTRERKAQFRLITATHKNLSEPGNGFRQDLFYRINGIVLELPRLRDRIEDMPLLAAAFLKEANFAYNRDVKHIPEQTLEIFLSYDWPGNIRELKWSIHRSVATAKKDVLEITDLTIKAATQKRSLNHMENDLSETLGAAIAELEIRYIKKALAATGDNKTEAARLLGISVRQLHYKIAQYSI
ncbi:MAG: sigma-54-dependent Fis family transcriptional regulator [Candidatus Riflebacteria bacterium]|nr:sigma-54-dependent Fis family transcriptional regulator [Candidatus Riflebacteria bacterium]